MKYDLSILICTLPNRNPSNLILELNRQAQKHSVQIIYLGDNKSMSVGEKRNRLLSMADGTYVTFVDDDDTVSVDYVDSIFEMIPKGFDVITYQVQKYFNGAVDRIQRFSREYGLNHRSPDKVYNNYLPNHLCVWKRSVIKSHFPHISLSEDHQWAQLMLPHYKSEGHIDKILYFYHFNKETTETQK